MKTLVIAGASGFIGSYLIEHATMLGWKVKTIGRKQADATWNDQPSLMRVLDGADAIINLAGKSVNCRFTADNIEALIRSRVDTTQAIGDAIALCKQPPKTWINASGASIYPENATEANTEESTIDGDGVMADVARQWEKALYSRQLTNTRRIALRITLVLGKDGGVFPIYKRLVALGQGGAQGTGKQWVSWIHVADLTRLLFFIVGNDSIAGPVNAAAPEPLTNDAFMFALRKAMKFPFGIPAPAFLIRVGTAMIGADSELILRGMQVVSSKAPQQGFRFDYPSADAAFAALLKK
jgi:uncharacterized protein (TIGR01777 family)